MISEEEILDMIEYLKKENGDPQVIRCNPYDEEQVRMASDILGIPIESNERVPQGIVYFMAQ